MSSEFHELVNDLGKAKEAVMYCLEHETGLVDMHGLAYWANVVEETRKKIKEQL